MEEGSAQNVDAIEQVDDLRLISELVVRQWVRDVTSGTEDMRREGEARVARARRNARIILGSPTRSENANAPNQRTTSDIPRTDLQSHPGAGQQLRAPRPGLSDAIERQWRTQEGRIALLSLPMRELARRFGVASHTSFYDVLLFKEKICPLRVKSRASKAASDWLERNSRDRHR